jgi:predicted pore-forming effector associated with SMODS systems
VMNVFGTDSPERTSVPIALALVSIGAAWFLSVSLSAAGIQVPWFLDAPSPFAVFALLFAAFDRVLWTTSWVRRTGIIRVPNLNGTWKGTLVSSFDNVSRPVELTIYQTWRTILVALKTDGSGSKSTVAAIFVGDPDGPVLTYQYRNDPHADAAVTMNKHNGTATLILRGRRLEGDYYAGRGRLSFGTLSLEQQT